MGQSQTCGPPGFAWKPLHLLEQPTVVQAEMYAFLAAVVQDVLHRLMGWD